MVAKKTPMKEKRLAAALNPNLIRETVNKVDKCMARLQELQYTVNGGNKVIAGVSLSPRSTRGYLRTSLRCKQESLRMKNAAARKSPPGKLQGSANGEWRRMSLPAMLLGETVVEILQATQFAKELVSAASKMAGSNDPKTPNNAITGNKSKAHCESAELRVRRTREKQHQSRRSQRSEVTPLKLARAKSRITFKPTSPPDRQETKNSKAGRAVITAQRVSPKNRPWAKKAVLFPNPLFLSSSSSSSPPAQQHKFYKTRSPIIARTKPQIPHKFAVKSPTTSLKSQFKSKKAVPASPAEKAVMPKLRRCSFSPSKLANRLISPLKSRKVVDQRMNCGLVSGLKQRPGFSTPLRVGSSRRIGVPLRV